MMMCKKVTAMLTAWPKTLQLIKWTLTEQMCQWLGMCGAEKQNVDGRNRNCCPWWQRWSSLLFSGRLLLTPTWLLSVASREHTHTYAFMMASSNASYWQSYFKRTHTSSSNASLLQHTHTHTPSSNASLLQHTHTHIFSNNWNSNIVFVFNCKDLLNRILIRKILKSESPSSIIFINQIKDSFSIFVFCFWINGFWISFSSFFCVSYLYHKC